MVFWFWFSHILWILLDKEWDLVKGKKVNLSEHDIHIIDVYSKKNLADTMPQFGNPVDNLINNATDMSTVKKEETKKFF